MWKHYKKGKKEVGMAQTGAGWNVSTYSIGKGNRLRIYANKNFRTQKEALKSFTRQKKKVSRR